MGVVTMFAGMLVIMGLLICAMRVLVSVMMVVCMVMFVRVFMSMRHPVVMRVLMRMSVAVNVLMRVIVFDYCLGLPNKEFRLSVARSFRDAKINVGVNTECLPRAGQGRPQRTSPPPLYTRRSRGTWRNGLVPANPVSEVVGAARTPLTTSAGRLPRRRVCQIVCRWTVNRYANGCEGNVTCVAQLQIDSMS